MCEIKNTVVLLVNEHQSDQKRYYKRSSYTFSLCNPSRKKRPCQLNVRDFDIKEDFNQNGSLIIS